MALFPEKSGNVLLPATVSEDPTPAIPCRQLRWKWNERPDPARKAGKCGRDGGRHATRSLDDESPPEGGLGGPAAALCWKEH